MSQENVDFVTALFSGAEAMDKQALLEALPGFITEIADPDIEWIEDPMRADARTHRGHAGVLESWTGWLEQWDEYDWQVERFLDCGEHVLVFARERGSGAASGVTVSSRIFVVITLRAQKILRWREFYDEQSALAAAGLRE